MFRLSASDKTSQLDSVCLGVGGGVGGVWWWVAGGWGLVVVGGGGVWWWVVVGGFWWWVGVGGSRYFYLTQSTLLSNEKRQNEHWFPCISSQHTFKSSPTQNSVHISQN